MKRGRHTSEYDKVRREAGYAKPQHDFPDVDDEQASRERVLKKAAEFRSRMAVLEAQDAQRSAEMIARMDANSREISRRMIVREYQKQGITPPIDGVLVSLPLLLKLGWQISGIGDTKFLTRPDGKPASRKTREDYEAERSANSEGS